MGQVTAQLNSLRMAPRKVRAVVNLIKGKNALNALAQLDVMAKRPGSPVAKLLKSAMANGENNNNMVKENLYVKSIRVDEGIKLKRFKPKGFGRVSPIEKKTSHIELILAEKVPGIKRTSAGHPRPDIDGVLSRRDKGDGSSTKRSFGSGTTNVSTGTLGRKEGVLKSLGRRMFRRKSI